MRRPKSIAPTRPCLTHPLSHDVVVGGHRPAPKVEAVSGVLIWPARGLDDSSIDMLRVAEILRMVLPSVVAGIEASSRRTHNWLSLHGWSCADPPFAREHVQAESRRSGMGHRWRSEPRGGQHDPGRHADEDQHGAPDGYVITEFGRISRRADAWLRVCSLRVRPAARAGRSRRVGRALPLAERNGCRQCPRTRPTSRSGWRAGGTGNGHRAVSSA